MPWGASRSRWRSPNPSCSSPLPSRPLSPVRRWRLMADVPSIECVRKRRRQPMEYTTTPLTPHTGAEVRSIDLSEGVDAETRAALNRTFAEHHVLVVRGQQFTPPQFIIAAQVFGELFQHDKREMHVPGYPQIYYVSNEQTVPGKRYISGETFHTDHSNHPAPPKATMLFPVSLPSSGGDTQY